MAIAPHMVAFGRAASAASEMFSLIDRTSEINPFDESGERPEEAEGVIHLNGVDFQYPTRPDIRVLKDFSLHVPAGKVTALVVSLQLNLHLNTVVIETNVNQGP